MNGTITVAGQQILLPTIRQVYPTLLAQQIVGVQPMTSTDNIFTMKASYSPQSKYKFSRAKWYVADYDWVHQGKVLEWCKEQFGPHPKTHDAWSRWWVGIGYIRFRDAKDYEWFVLRWS